MSVWIVLAIIALIIWGGFALIFNIIGGLVDFTGGWFNLLLALVAVFVVISIVKSVRSK